MFERLIYNKLTSFMYKNKISKREYGFMTKCARKNVLYFISESIYYNFNKKTSVIIILLEHRKLLTLRTTSWYRRNYIGMTLEVMLTNLMTDYLSKRKRKVVVNES